MIPGNTTRRITMYLGIDRLEEGFGWTMPDEGETFIGIPHSWYGKDSLPFIEVSKDSQVVRTVNPLDLSQIEFLDETTNPTTRKL